MKLCIILFFFSHFLSQANGRTFFVAPNGSDVSGNGTQINPWSTWLHASNEIRPLLLVMTEDFFILFDKGRYSLTNTILLGPNDSGQNGYTVTYASATGNASDVVFEDGIAINTWEEVNESGVYKASLPCISREVYAFEQRIQESPVINVNFTSKNTILTEYGYITSDSTLIELITAPNSLVIDSDVELIYTSAAAQWQESRARVQSWQLMNDSTLLNITMKQPGWTLIRKKQYAETLPTSLVNILVLESLQPGQGVISTTTSLIYYRPILSSGGSMVNANAWVASIDGELLLLAGKSYSPTSSPLFIQNIRIENVTFQGSTWLAPTIEGAYSPDQGGIVYRASDLPNPLGGHAIHPVPAALTLRTGSNITLFNVIVKHTGGTGIAIEQGSRNCHIVKASVLDTGCSGVRLGQVNDATLTDPSGFNMFLSLTDSTLEYLSQGYRDCSAIFGGFISQTTIIHNFVNNSNWAGITLGWGGWGGCPYRPNLGGNKILGNFISNVNLITGDGGPIYVMAQQQSRANCSSDDLSCRSEMAYNYVSYAMHHAALLYHDEGSAFYYTHNNVVLQPSLVDPHGWWWSWAAAWASSESNILITDNYAQGVNRSDVYNGNNLIITNNSLQAIGSTWPDAALEIIANAGPRI